jgi:hypothetical protein
LVLRVGGQLELAFLKMFLDVLQKKLLIIARIQILQQLRHVRLDLGEVALRVVTVLGLGGIGRKHRRVIYSDLKDCVVKEGQHVPHVNLGLHCVM